VKGKRPTLLSQFSTPNLFVTCALPLAHLDSLSYFLILLTKGVKLLSIKSKLLKKLQECEDDFVSGAALANELLVSRAAIWKAVESLRAEGYGILAVTNKGYQLQCSGDILSGDGIAGYIKTPDVFKVEVLKKVTSTNSLLREMAARGESEGYVLAAEEQTEGKGRIGKKFHSPARHGVYFSLLLRPGSKTKDATLITSAAAVAVARAIESVFGVNTGIKWVNDLFVGDKKVCGILTEASFDMESGLVESAVLGIGINITSPETGFPDDIRDVATAVTDRNTGMSHERCKLIAATLDNFWEFYQNLEKRAFLNEYRLRSIILNKAINVISQDGQRHAVALAIDDDCRLLVRYDTGETAALGSGEVSIRSIESET